MKGEPKRKAKHDARQFELAYCQACYYHPYMPDLGRALLIIRVLKDFQIFKFHEVLEVCNMSTFFLNIIHRYLL